MNRLILELLCCACLLVRVAVCVQQHDGEMSSRENEKISGETRGDGDISDELIHSKESQKLSGEEKSPQTEEEENEEETEEKESAKKLINVNRSKRSNHKRTRRSDESGKEKKKTHRKTSPAPHVAAQHQEQEEHEGREHGKGQEEHGEEEHHNSHGGAHAWKYYGDYGPGNWSLVAPDCSADRLRQTPIDIRTTNTKVDETMSDIELVVTNPKKGEGITMTNNGHTVNLVFDNTMQVTGGKLGNAYHVAGVHFHWGVSEYTGSEHTINGKRFPLEMHIVSYDKHRYSDVGEALKGDNSLAVLGVLFTISEKDNPDIEPIVSNLMSVQLKGTSTRLRHFYLTSLLPTKYSTNFYRYLGSLTTPPCSEVVVWSVFEHTIGISRSQLEYFHQLYEGKNSVGEQQFLAFNWRPIQQLHDRTVVRSFIHQSVHVHHHHHHPSTEAAPPQLKQLAAPAVNAQETGCNCPNNKHSSALEGSTGDVPLIALSASVAALLRRLNAV